MAWQTVKRFSILVRPFLAIALFGAHLAQAAAPSDAVYAGINDLRMNQCPAASAANGALAVSVNLEEAARRRAGGEPLSEALSASTVQFSSAEVMVVGGDLRTALSRLASRYCGKLADTGYTHVGAVFIKDRWWVVLGSIAEAAAVFNDTAMMAVVAPEAVGPQILERVNTARKQARICGEEFFAAASDMTWSEPLKQAASLHAADMARHRYFDHTSHEGESVSDRAQAFGYQFRAIGENIAAAPADEIDLVMAGWLKSPGHCANIMNPLFTETGAAVAHLHGSLQGKWVLVFGKPQ